MLSGGENEIEAVACSEVWAHPSGRRSQLTGRYALRLGAGSEPGGQGGQQSEISHHWFGDFRHPTDTRVNTSVTIKVDRILFIKPAPRCLF